jgi:uncharacterized membrane protein
MVFENLLNVGYIVSLLVNAIVAFIAIVLADKLIAHNFDAKHSFIMAIVALFVTPIILGFIFGFLSLPVFIVGGIEIISGFILPLVVWIALGELLLQADRITKLKVIIIAFVVYLILSIFLTPFLMGLLPF